MKILKLAIISFIFFFVLITIVSLFIPSHIQIARVTTINAPREQVMQQLNDPVNWKNWFPVKDSVRYMFVEGEVRGIVLDSLEALMLSGKNDSIVNAISAGRVKREFTMGWFVVPNSNPSQVTVQWWMDFRLRWYPWEKFASLLFDKQYGTRLEMGLRRLKDFVENN